MAADDKSSSSSSTEWSIEAPVISPNSPSHLTHFKPLTPEQDEPPLRSAYSSFVNLFRFSNKGEVWSHFYFRLNPWMCQELLELTLLWRDIKPQQKLQMKPQGEFKWWKTSWKWRTFLSDCVHEGEEELLSVNVDKLGLNHYFDQY